MSSNEKNILSKLSYSIDKNGEIFVDIIIDDYSEDTLKKLALLLASIQTPSFELQTLSIVQQAFFQEDKADELQFLVKELLNKRDLFDILQTDDYDEEEKDEENDDPLIKPTDLT